MSIIKMPAPAEEDLVHVLDVVGEPDWHRLRGRRIFVTGGTGIIGKWLLSSLMEASRRHELTCTVTVLSRDPDTFLRAMPQLFIDAPMNIELLRGDVRDFQFPPGSRHDIVIHAATDVIAQNPPEVTFSTCVDGTRRALDFAEYSGAGDFLLLSSGAVYGRQVQAVERLSEEYPGAPDPLLPSSAYGEGKRVSEWLACARAARGSLRVKIARCFAMVGPYLPLDKHFAIGNFIRDCLAGNDIVIQGDGTPYRSYLYMADVAAWLWTVLLRGRSGLAYNVGSPDGLSIADLARRVAAILTPGASVRTLKTAPPGLGADRYVPDVTRAGMELGLRSSLPLDEAIVRTANWYCGWYRQS